MTTLRAIGAMPGVVPVAGERLRRVGVDRLLLAFSILWVVFVITGFRLPWQPIEQLENNPGRRQLVFTIGGFLALRAMIRTGSFGQIVSQHIGLLFLGGWMMTSVLWSADVWLTVKRSTIFLLGFLLLVATVHVHPRPVRFYLRAIVYSVGVLAWTSLIAAVVLPAECSSIELRPGLAGVSVHPNVLGPCLQIGFMLSLGIDHTTRTTKWILRGLQLGILIALLETDSITSIVSTLVGVVLFLALTVRSYRAGVIQLLLVAGVVVMFVLGIDDVREAFFQTANRDASLSGRDQLWSQVFDAGLQNPVFGMGYGSFWYEDRGWELTGNWNPRQSHHAYLDVFVDLGALGLLCLFFVLLAKLWTGWRQCAGPRGTRRRRAVAAIVAMGVALCGVSAFSESFFLKLDKFQFFVLLWAVILLESRDSNRIDVEMDSSGEPHPEAG